MGGRISFGVDLSGGKDRAWERRLVMVVRCSRGEVDIHLEAAGDGDCTVPVRSFVAGWAIREAVGGSFGLLLSG